MYIAKAHLTMLNWGVMFCKIISVIVCSIVLIYAQLTQHIFVSQLVPFISHVFEIFVFIPEFTNPSVVELSVLRGVTGCSRSNAITAGCMSISVFLLFRVPQISDLSAEDTALHTVLHYVCMGPFLSELGFIGLVEGQSLR